MIWLIGCYRQPGTGAAPPDDVLQFATRQVNALRSKNLASVETNFSPSVATIGLGTTLEKMAALFPVDEPRAVKVVAFRQSKNGAGTDLALEYELPHEWILVRISILKSSDGFLISGLFINPISSSVEEMTGWGWAKRGVKHYIFLSAAVIMPLFILTVFVICLRSRLHKRKWLWLVFILFGIGQFTLNWHTGEISVKPLQFLFLGAGYFAPMLYSPLAWPLYIMMSLPVGAIVFLVRRKRLLAIPVNEPGTTAAPPA
jgi:hypothetical protein